MRSAAMTLVSCWPALLSSAWTRSELLVLERKLAELSSSAAAHQSSMNLS
jgi:hypothetical protein